MFRSKLYAEYTRCSISRRKDLGDLLKLSRRGRFIRDGGSTNLETKDRIKGYVAPYIIRVSSNNYIVI